MRRVQSQRVYKSEEIYVCIACEKMYTIEMIDEHLNKCEKLEQKEKEE
jgi:hypothetical protein